MRWRIIAGLAALVLALDQAVKQWVISSLETHEVITVTVFFNLVSVRNRGAAFGFLNSHDISWQFWFFMAATLLAAGIIWFVARSARERDRFLFAGLGAIMGGAFGNAIDRIRFREVVDFLDFHYAGMHWPAFNIADIAICLGAAVTAVYMLRGDALQGKEADASLSAKSGRAASGKNKSTSATRRKQDTL